MVSTLPSEFGKILPFCDSQSHDRLTLVRSWAGDDPTIWYNHRVDSL